MNSIPELEMLCEEVMSGNNEDLFVEPGSLMAAKKILRTLNYLVYKRHDDSPSTASIDAILRLERDCPTLYKNIFDPNKPIGMMYRDYYDDVFDFASEEEKLLRKGSDGRLYAGLLRRSFQTFLKDFARDLEEEINEKMQSQIKRDDPPELVIIRGVPGSGKSTFAKVQFPNHKLFETDKFFYQKDENGKSVYKFEPHKLSKNYEKCLGAVKDSLMLGNDTVVANTFISRWEIAEYYDFCRDNGFPIRIYRMQNKYPNEHGVSDEKVQSMSWKMKSVPGEFKVPAGAKLEFSDDFKDKGSIDGKNLNMWDDEPTWHKYERYDREHPLDRMHMPRS